MSNEGAAIEPSGRRSRVRRLRLRPVLPRDHAPLYNLVLSEGTRAHWRYRGATPSFDEFQHDLWREVLAQYIVETLRPATPVALVRAHNANLKNRIVYISVLGFPRYRRSGLPLVGLRMLIDELFASWDFRKIYVEILETNLSQFVSAMDRLVVEEGCLKEFELVNGKHVDLLIGAIPRERWNQIRRLSDRASEERATSLTDKSDKLHPEEFCQALYEVLATMHPAIQVPTLDDHFIDDLGLDSLELLELQEIVFEVAPAQDEVLTSNPTVRDLYLQCLRGQQLPQG